MSCNGCRVLRKGCSETCVLRACLRWIDSPEAQGHATIFVAKFFGRAGLVSFVSAVPDSQRPALFRSLLFEACGRTVNPVTGAVGMLWEGRWEELEAAVDAVLRGETIRARTTGEAGGAAAGSTQTHTHCRTRMGKDERGESPSEGSVTTSDGVDGRIPGSTPPPVLLNLFP